MIRFLLVLTLVLLAIASAQDDRTGAMLERFTIAARLTGPDSAPPAAKRSRR